MEKSSVDNYPCLGTYVWLFGIRIQRSDPTHSSKIHCDSGRHCMHCRHPGFPAFFLCFFSCMQCNTSAIHLSHNPLWVKRHNSKLNSTCIYSWIRTNTPTGNALLFIPTSWWWLWWSITLDSSIFYFLAQNCSASRLINKTWWRWIYVWLSMFLIIHMNKYVFSMPSLSVLILACSSFSSTCESSLVFDDAC
jgi:hypothetical protein